MTERICIRGAREHNLKNIHLSLPRGEKIIVITGPSGSGKSSLAFDTLYAEGQRRYVESLSTYARQFLDTVRKPDMDSIEGLSPAIAIEQKTTSRNPRSTVATVTEIYDYMRLLFARIGVPYSPATGKPIQAQTVSEMAEKILALPAGRLCIMAPLIRGRKGEFRKEMQDIQRRGFVRIQIDGALYDLDDHPLLEKTKKHTIHVVIDRLRLSSQHSKIPKDQESSDDKNHALNSALRQRVVEACELALKTSPDELVLIDHWPELEEKAENYAVSDPKAAPDVAASSKDPGRSNTTTDKKNTILFSARFSCPESGFSLEKLEPRLFSFNSPFGACTSCDGLGVAVDVDLNKIIPDEELSLEDGVLAPWGGGFFHYYLQMLRALSEHYNFSVRESWKDLPDTAKQLVLYGSGKDKISMVIQDEKRSFKSEKPFEGLIPALRRRYKDRDQSADAHDLGKWYAMAPCEACQGKRLKPEALCVKIAGKSIDEVAAMSVQKAVQWFQDLTQQLSAKEKTIGERILKEIQDRLGFLNHVGVGYLNLARSAATLSGGEAQRIRLASQIGSGLVGVLYVLDEPSIGLHQRDNQRLIETLKHLRGLGNTVVVVEHDEETIRAADYLVDMGPGAGALGGQVVAEGSVDEVLQNPKSLTGGYLQGRYKIDVPQVRRPCQDDKKIVLTGASSHNLKQISGQIPLGVFVCVTGVSGSGKSSLINHTLRKALAKKLNRAQEAPGPYVSLSGLEQLDKIVAIDQSPIGRTPRSNPATYTGLFGPLRDWFASLPLARARGYGPGRFSFNVKGGRCESCRGDGVTKVEMHFLPDVYVTCDACGGKRYNPETLAITYKNKTISDVLSMTVDEAFAFFSAMPPLKDRLSMLKDVGLGYIHVGQQATTLSGGEAQRIKLSKELSKRATGRTFYILDEPTTGLHMDDVKKLLAVLHRLVDQGNTVVVIEHNLDVIKTADWVIDMGPEGGDGGGQIIAQGTPEQIAQVPESYTGQFLKPLLGKA